MERLWQHLARYTRRGRAAAAFSPSDLTQSARRAPQIAADRRRSQQIAADRSRSQQTQQISEGHFQCLEQLGFEIVRQVRGAA
jgi:hypothetical protein